MSRANGHAVAERPTAKRRKGHVGTAQVHSPRVHSHRRHRRGGGDGAPAGGPRPVWSGSISFGLVNIPVRLFTAVREQRVVFHLLHDQDKARLRRKLVCPADGRQVHPEHVVRGFEVEKDKFVTVSEEELEGCAPDKTRAIQITDFVELDEIDPIYYERPYYILPTKEATHSYRLLMEAMRRSKRVGVARVVIHEKEYLAALRPLGGVICLCTMHLSDEIVPADDVDVGHVKPDERERKLADKIIAANTEKFDPSRHRDEYLDCVRQMVERKARDEKVVAPPAAEQEGEKKQHTARAADLMAALEASLARAKGQAKRRKSA